VYETVTAVVHLIACHNSRGSGTSRENNPRAVQGTDTNGQVCPHEPNGVQWQQKRGFVGGRIYSGIAPSGMESSRSLNGLECNKTEIKLYM